MTSPRKRLDEEPDDLPEEFIPYRQDRAIRPPPREPEPAPEPGSLPIYPMRYDAPPVGAVPTIEDVTRPDVSGIINRVNATQGIDRLTALDDLCRNVIQHEADLQRTGRARAAVGPPQICMPVYRMDEFYTGQGRVTRRIEQTVSGFVGRLGGFFLLADVVFPSQGVREAVIARGMELDIRHNSHGRNTRNEGHAALHDGAISTFILGTPTAPLLIDQYDYAEMHVQEGMPLEGHPVFVILSGVTQRDL